MNETHVVEVGGIYAARPMDPRQRAALVLVTDVVDGKDVGVTLLSLDTEFSTNLDLLLSPADTGLSYTLLAQSDVFGYLPTVQLDQYLGMVCGAALDALDALRDDDVVNSSVAGSPVLH